MISGGSVATLKTVAGGSPDRNWAARSQAARSNSLSMNRFCWRTSSTEAWAPPVSIRSVGMSQVDAGAIVVDGYPVLLHSDQLSRFAQDRDRIPLNGSTSPIFRRLPMAWDEVTKVQHCVPDILI